MRRVLITAVLSASTCAAVALLACGGEPNRTSGHNGPCSDSYGFLDFATADGFTGAGSELERHLGDGFPAPEPPDWATQFAVARGTLRVAQTDADGNVRNVESPYKYGWLRYGSNDPSSPSVMVGTREIPFCDAQLAALEKERVSTSSGRLDVLTLWVDDAKRSAATALFQVDGKWTLVKMEWPDSPADGNGELVRWISAVVDASERKR